AALCALVGIAVLVSDWALGEPLALMKPSTAACFALAGAVLWVLSERPAARGTGSGRAHGLADRGVLPAAGPRPAQPGPRPGLPDRPAARGGLRVPLPARRR